LNSDCKKNICISRPIASRVIVFLILTETTSITDNWHSCRHSINKSRNCRHNINKNS